MKYLILYFFCYWCEVIYKESDSFGERWVFQHIKKKLFWSVEVSLVEAGFIVDLENGECTSALLQPDLLDGLTVRLTLFNRVPLSHSQGEAGINHGLIIDMD